MHQRFFASAARRHAGGRGSSPRIHRRRCAPGIEPLERRLCLSGLFAPAPGPPFSLGYGPYIPAVGDFNGDGLQDLALVDAANDTLSVLLGNGRGGFVAAPGPGTAVGNVSHVAVGDFSGDGKLDLAYANANNDTVSVFLGNGDGTFTPAPGPPITVGAFPSDIVAGDFTGNGKLDLVVANEMSGDLTVLLGNGNGTFTAAPGSPVAIDGQPVRLAVGDFNGDGKLDLAVALLKDNSGDPDAVEVLSGNGDGTFTAAGAPISLPGSSISAIGVGDFTGDGKLDIAACDAGGDDVSVLLGNGNGTFVTAPGSPIAVGSDPGVIGVGDFTGNGRQDLAVANDGDISVLLGNANGAFSKAPGSPIRGGFVAVGDFDGVSRPDLVVANAKNTLSVLLNSSPELATGPLGATLSASLPATIVGGVRIKGTASVTVTAPVGAAVKGPVSVALYASQTASLSGGTQLMPAITRTLTLKAGASKTLRLALSSFPPTLAGTYYLVAQVTAPDGTSTVAVGPSVSVAKPVVSILASSVTGSPAAAAPEGKLSLRLTLQNTGNVPAAGTAGLTISLSTSPSGADSSPVATVPLRVKLWAAKSGAYRVKFRLPSGTAAGSYYLVASLAVGALGDTNTADGVAVSGSPITVT